MAHQSLMKSILEACLAVCSESGGEATTDAVSIRVGAKDRKGHKRVLNVLSDLLRQGRISRIRQGVYGPPTGDSTLSRAEVMWRVLRMRRRVQIDDLVEMAGASPSYAREWLAMLVRRGVVAKVQQPPGGRGVWQLTNDQVDMPENVDKAEALRALRLRRKKEALEKMETAGKALVEIEKMARAAKTAVGNAMLALTALDD
jgi:predicted transcriptional regulator